MAAAAEQFFKTQVRRAKDTADIQGDRCKEMRAAMGDGLGSVNAGEQDAAREESGKDKGVGGLAFPPLNEIIFGRLRTYDVAHNHPRHQLSNQLL